MIEAGKQYRIRGNSDYFREKYGIPTPIIEIKDEDTELFEGGWRAHDGPACTIYGWRNGVELLPTTDDKVYYGHVFCIPITPDSSPVGLGELVHGSELEPHEGPLTLPSSRNITFEKSDPGLIRGSAPPKEPKVSED